MHTALIASALFAVFPLAVVSARVLWNPALVPLFTLLFMRAVYGVIVDGRSRWVIAASAAFAVLTQLHVATIALGAVGLIAWALFRPRVRLRDAGLGALAFVVLYAPYLLYEISHRFENLRAFASAAAPDRSVGSAPALRGIVENLGVLFRPVLDGFLVAEPWAPPFRMAFSALYAVEALLFGLGLAVSLYRLARSFAGHTDGPSRRALVLLVLWMALPILLLGTRRTAIWWYYLDLLYPSQFILAGVGLVFLGSLLPGHGRGRAIAASASAGLVAAIAATQGWFLVGLERRIDAQGTVAFDATRLSVSAEGGSLGEITTLPFHHRFEILRTLVEDVRLDGGDLGKRVHGAVLGLPQESDYLERYLTSRRGKLGAPTSTGTHVLVRKTGDGIARRTSGGRRIGPYAVIEYEPRIDYASWRYAVVPLDAIDDLPESAWTPVTLPSAHVGAVLRVGDALVLRGRLRVSAGAAIGLLGVDLIGEGPLVIDEVRGGEVKLSPIAQSSARSLTRASTGLPLLYWTGETVFESNHRLQTSDALILIAVSGRGRVLSVDVWDAPGP